MAYKRFSVSCTVVLFLLVILVPDVFSQRKKHPDRYPEEKSEHDPWADKSLKLSEQTSNSGVTNPFKSHIQPLKKLGRHHHRNKKKQPQHKSGFGLSVPAIQEETYFTHKPKPSSVHEKKLFSWDDDEFISSEKNQGVTKIQDYSLSWFGFPTTAEYLETSSKKLNRRQNKKKRRKWLGQSGYESVVHGPPRNSTHPDRRTHLPALAQHRDRSRYPSSSQTQHQTVDHTRTHYEQSRGSRAHFPSSQHHTRDRSSHQPRYHPQRGPIPPPTPYPPRGSEDSTTYSRTRWANRTIVRGSYFNRTDGHPQPPDGTHHGHAQPEHPKLDIDTIYERESRYGPYSPGDLEDLGIKPEDFSPHRNISIGTEIHPLSVVYRPGGPRNLSCESRSCYPATGNLLIGREEFLHASSTCGLHKKERYCIVSHLEDRKKCFLCDSRSPEPSNLSHRIGNIVPRFGSRKKTWWQSENGKEHVYIQLDLEAEFHFTHLIITFKTFRPSAMLIERSFDFGQTWQVYRYFAHDCAESFPGVPRGAPRKFTDVVCVTRYSTVDPSTEGEIIFRVLPPNLPINDPYSSEVQKLLKMTNLRVNFTKLHTLGDNLLDQRDEIKEKYYYAIYDMTVRGSCSCYGHASRCVPIRHDRNYPPDMVHGKCECTHHTKGQNCEQCEDFYQDLPWQPAYDNVINACKRCNCNNHATRCHFDKAVFIASGNISGGVCDDCEHNTMGRHCEFCKPFYYRDPGYELSDLYVCQPCDCDPRGSLDDGICDPYTDEEINLEAGRCSCKLNVEGRRCDHCKVGFWNFSPNNPHGCEPCTCHHLGTVESQGCNQYNGECTCKRYVTGRNCNQCMPEHWGLSEDRDGCRQCDCDPGGAYDNNCDVITGQCRCRSHVAGRRCDQPDQGYFANYMDYLTFESELAQGSENTQVIVRELYTDRDNTWTGVGFTRVFEGSTLEFDLDNIQTTLDYDIVIRYEPQSPRTWEYAQVIVERPGPIDLHDKCANSVPQDDRKQVSFPSGNRYSVVYPPACLEKGKRYKLRIEFKRYDKQVETPNASILIDSVVLIPRIENIPFFQGTPVNEYRRQEFERLRCAQIFFTVAKGTIHETCKRLLFSIGVYVHGGAQECNCDQTGSVSSICDTLGGFCQCKTLVVGRRCDRCAPGNYGFGPTGCRACDCNSIGSLDNLCDGQTGQCKCRPNTYGRQCDECNPGFWNYPTCQRCECHGHADTCESHTGHCVDCRSYTSGPHCDRCENGFYGDPRQGINIPCRQCPCPGSIETGHSFADTCHLDSHLRTVICNCKEGYAGERCDKCADNFFGNPDVPGGKCEKCNCNNNIDFIRPGNCHHQTGECLQCIFNTEGFSCERCKPGFYGDAINQRCLECVCHPLGWNSTSGPCDHYTGQCPCFPNVEGQKCDRCKENHWKIASGEGCSPCACDPHGSLSQQCNEYDGQCQCKSGFGGRRCNECEQNYWGNPNIECFSCNCNRDGSSTLQCHRNNGSCICIPGIGGEKCDTCARGYTGNAPYCNSCGECFENWDLIIQNLKVETHQLIKVAKTIKHTGATGAYTNEFKEMEDNLARVEEILANSNITKVNIGNWQELIDELRNNLTDSKKYLALVDDRIGNTTDRIYEARVILDELLASTNQVKESSKSLKDRARKLQEADVDGALNITRDANNRSRQAELKVQFTDDVLRKSEYERKRAENLIDHGEALFNRTFLENERGLQNIENQLTDLEKQIPGLNKKVCDGEGDPCDILCGGAGCDGKCGGISCDKGAKTKADNALQLAINTNKELSAKDKQALDLQINIINAKKDADQAKFEAQVAYDKALAASNQSENLRAAVDDLLRRIEEFMDDEKANAAQIRTVAEKVMNQSISLDPEQIKDLARQIKAVIDSLTNIDEILAKTAGDLAFTKSLKERADRAKKQAERVLETSKEVLQALDDASDEQKKAKEAIDRANADINFAEKDLAQIGSETAAAQEIADKSNEDIENLKTRLNNLKKKTVENEISIRKADNQSQEAVKIAEKAEKRADELEEKYNDALKLLEAKAKHSGSAKEEAEALRDRANQLYYNVTSKLRELQDIEGDFQLNEKNLEDLSSQIDALNKKMTEYLEDIEKKSAFYRDCQT